MSYTLTASITRENKYFIAKCVELGVVSQGKTLDESMAHLKEAVSLYLENNPIKKSQYISPSFISSFEVKV